MKSFSKINIPIVIIGFSMLFAGANIVYRGNVWNLVLGNERYFVGGLALLVGVYLSILGFIKPPVTNNNDGSPIK
jgi:hypothetical protein